MIAVISDIILYVSLVFFALGIYGLFKLPDAYTRMHALGMCDSLGVGLINLALFLKSHGWILRLKLVIALLLFWGINTTMTHLTAKAVMLYGPRPSKDTKTEKM
ncbi:MAG: monovalent cation/H(+) antiporter subunit G [Oscillospiraceae bacterium]|nr:monovalent cation/H(+) antiporter subunit G [Oscillospiraceae bacterium]